MNSWPEMISGTLLPIIWKLQGRDLNRAIRSDCDFISWQDKPEVHRRQDAFIHEVLGDKWWFTLLDRELQHYARAVLEILQIFSMYNERDLTSSCFLDAVTEAKHYTEMGANLFLTFFLGSGFFFVVQGSIARSKCQFPMGNNRPTTNSTKLNIILKLMSIQLYVCNRRIKFTHGTGGKSRYHHMKITLGIRKFQWISPKKQNSIPYLWP